MGHEFIGVVEETGPAVTSARRGDFVISTFAFQDNTCAFCREGFQTACVHGGWYGANGIGGTQAEAVRVPRADGTLIRVPGMTEESELLPSLLTLADVYLTGWHGAHMGRVEPGKTVTVIGDGAVGLSAVLASRQLGAERIILMGRHKDRTDLGTEWGALTRGEGSHVVIEAVGLMPAYQQAYGIVRPGGVISRVGVPQYEDAPVGFGSLFGKNATLTGGPAPVRAYIEQALPDVLDGRINPGKVFDAGVSLDEIAAGYQAMDARTALKVLVTP
jgi:threonine dehydrogenase-like Zn-dependent dehydrogenase